MTAREKVLFSRNRIYKQRNVLHTFFPTLKRKASGCYKSCLYLNIVQEAVSTYSLGMFL